MKHYVYIYFDQNGEPIYVGKGKGRRFKVHLNGACNPYLRNKIAKMRRNGFEPTVRIVARFETHEEALDAEVWLIAGYRAAGIKLCNLTDGGEGVINLSSEILAKRNAAIGRAHRKPELQAAASARMTERMSSPEIRADNSARMKARHKRPDFREVYQAAMTEGRNRPEVLEKQAISMTDWWNSPGIRETMTACFREAQNRPEVKAANSASQKIAQNRPEVKAAKSSSKKIFWTNLGVKETLSAIFKKYANSRARLVTPMKHSYFGITPFGLKWRAQYRGKSLGTFDTAIEAARAYNLVAEHKNRVDDLPIDFPDRRVRASDRRDAI